MKFTEGVPARLELHSLHMGELNQIGIYLIKEAMIQGI